MDNSPQISVIVPIYNVAEYLPQCLDSLIEQTYRNIEIVAIDDGSTDESGRILDDYAARDARVRAVHIANGGVSNARNVGLDLATGDYIGFVDSDDWIDTSMYERLLAAMTEDVDVACGGYVLEFADGHQELDIRLENEPKIYGRTAALSEVFSTVVPKRTAWVLCDKLFRKKLVTNVRFDTNILNAEDMLFFWQAMCECRSFALLPLVGYHYRMRVASMVHNRLTGAHVTAWTAFYRLYHWSEKEPTELRTTIELCTLQYAIAMARLMLLLDARKYSEDIQRAQAFIRPRVMWVLTSAAFSLRMKLGAIYLSLPLLLARALRRLVVKSKE